MFSHLCTLWLGVALGFLTSIFFAGCRYPHDGDPHDGHSR